MHRNDSANDLSCWKYCTRACFLEKKPKHARITVAAEPMKHLQDRWITPWTSGSKLSPAGVAGDWPHHRCSLCAPCRASRWCVKRSSSAGTTTRRPGSRRSALRSASASSGTTTSSREGAVRRRRSPKTAPWPPPSSTRPRAPKRREVAP